MPQALQIVKREPLAEAAGLSIVRWQPLVTPGLETLPGTETGLPAAPGGLNLLNFARGATVPRTTFQPAPVTRSVAPQTRLTPIRPLTSHGPAPLTAPLTAEENARIEREIRGGRTFGEAFKEARRPELAVSHQVNPLAALELPPPANRPAAASFDDSGMTQVVSDTWTRLASQYPEAAATVSAIRVNPNLSTHFIAAQVVTGDGKIIRTMDDPDFKAPFAIEIAPDLPPEQLESILAHELVHVVSGRGTEKAALAAEKAYASAPSSPAPRLAEPSPGTPSPSVPSRAGALTALRKAKTISAQPQRGPLDYAKNALRAVPAGALRFNVGFWGGLEAAGDVLGLPSVSSWARELGAQAEQMSQAIRGPQTGAGPTEQAIYGGFESIGLSVPALAAGMATGSPNITLALFGSTAGGEAYSEAREKGIAVPQALGYAVSQGVIEAATEKIPASRLLGDLTKRSGLMKMVIGQLSSEVPGEQVATVLQDLNDWAVLNPDQPFKSYLDARPSAAAQTLVSTLVATIGQTAGLATIDRVTRMAEQVPTETPAAETPPAAVAAPTPPPAGSAPAESRTPAAGDLTIVLAKPVVSGPRPPSPEFAPVGEESPAVGPATPAPTDMLALIQEKIAKGEPLGTLERRQDFATRQAYDAGKRAREQAAEAPTAPLDFSGLTPLTGEPDAAATRIESGRDREEPVRTGAQRDQAAVETARGDRPRDRPAAPVEGAPAAAEAETVAPPLQPGDPVEVTRPDGTVIRGTLFGRGKEAVRIKTAEGKFVRAKPEDMRRAGAGSAAASAVPPTIEGELPDVLATLPDLPAVKAKLLELQQSAVVPTREVNWGPQPRGQGRRAGGKQVVGAMSSAPTGKKTYPDVERAVGMTPDLLEKVRGLDQENVRVVLGAIQQGIPEGQALLLGYLANDPAELARRVAARPVGRTKKAPFALTPESAITQPVQPELTTLGMAQRGPRPTPNMAARAEKQLRPSEIVEALSRRMGDLPIRIGKFRQRALGIYKTKPQVVRTKIANDLDTLAHELGHHIDEALIGTGASLLPGFRRSVSSSRNPVINKELAGLGQATSRPGYTAAQIRKEGAAEFLRFYLSDPTVLDARAPTYLATFEEALATQPELQSVLLWAREQYQGYLAQAPSERVLAKVDFKGTDTAADQIDRLTQLQTAWVDDLAPLRHAVTAMADGRPVDVLDDAYKLARLARGAPAKADGFLRFGPQTQGGQVLAGSFKAALQPVQKQIRDFTAFLVASRVIELKGRRGLETGIDLDDARATVAALDSPVFQQAQDALYAYQDGVLRYAQDAGVLSHEQVTAMREANRFYVPFRRIQEALDGYLQGGGAARRLANRAVPIKRYRGSGVDIVNPLESIVRNTHAIVDMVEKNRALQVLVAQAESTPGAGKWIEKIPPPQELTRVNLVALTREVGRALDASGVAVSTVQSEDGPQLEIDGNVIDLDQIVNLFTPAHFVKGEKGLITVVQDGKRGFYQVNNLALYDAITAIGVKSSDLVINLFMVPARLLRTGATLTVGFLSRNPVRDSFTAATNTRYGFTLGYGTLNGLFSFLKKDEYYRLFLNSNAGNSALIGPDRNRIREALAEMGADGRRRWLNTTTLNPLNLLRALSEAGENATRLGEFKLGLAQEGRIPEGLARAALAARDVSIDFARGGRYSKEINRYTAFFNATAQGMARIAEVFSGSDTAGSAPPGRSASEGRGISRADRALSATFRAVTAIMVPTLALWFINRDDEEWREIPAWEKLAYWHIPNPSGGFFKVPTPFDLFTVFGAMPLAAMEYLYAKDPTVAKQLFPDAETAWAVLMGVMPTAILPVVEVVTNYDTYRKRPIVSPWDLGLDKALQSNRWTSELAKDVGPKLGLAPAKFDHLFYGYLAGLGRAGVGAIDLARGQRGERSRGSVRQWPLVGDPVNAFSRPYAGSDAQSIQDLYAARDTIAGAQASIKTWRTRRELEKAKAIEADLRATHGPHYVGRLTLVNAAIKRLSDLRKDLDRIWADERQSPQSKRTRQDRIFEQMVNTARRGLGRPPLPSRFTDKETAAGR